MDTYPSESQFIFSMISELQRRFDAPYVQQLGLTFFNLWFLASKDDEVEAIRYCANYNSGFRSEAFELNECILQIFLEKVEADYYEAMLSDKTMRA
jgi:hypothetical protein